MENRSLSSWSMWRLVVLPLAACCALAFSSCSGSNSTGGTQASQAATNLDTFLAGRLQSSKARGATLYVITPSGEYSAAAGLADPANNVAMTSSVRMRIGSVTKTFVAVAALKTLDRYAVSLDSLMEGYAGSPPAALRNVTFRQALGMTAGLPEYIGLQNYESAASSKPSRQPWTAAEILAFIGALPPDFTPGSAYKYSNTNFIALQAAIEGMTGQSIAAVVREHSLTPAGLQETFMELAETRDGGFGGVTARGFDGGADVTEVNDSLGMADGGLVSTSAELARFIKALAIDKSLLSAGQLAQMTIWYASQDYGLGLERINTGLGEAWGHSGAAAGFSGAMAAWPDKGYAAALLTNDLSSGLDEFALLEQAVKTVTGQ